MTEIMWDIVAAVILTVFSAMAIYVSFALADMAVNHHKVMIEVTKLQCAIDGMN